MISRKLQPYALQLLRCIQNVLKNYKYSYNVMLYNIMNIRAVVKICENDQESNKSWKKATLYFIAYFLFKSCYVIKV